MMDFVQAVEIKGNLTQYVEKSKVRAESMQINEIGCNNRDISFI